MLIVTQCQVVLAAYLLRRTLEKHGVAELIPPARPIDFRQLLLQICFFFAFAAVLGIGVGASNFIQDESARTEQQIGGIREIRQKTSQIQVLLTSMPPAYGMVRNAFEGIVEAATYTGGRNNPSAREIETRILESLDKLQMQCAVSAQPEECLATIASAKASLEALKTLQNA